MAWEVYMWTRCGCSCVMDAEYMARVVTSFVRELCRILRWLNMICVALSPRMLRRWILYRACGLEAVDEEGLLVW